MKRFLLVLLVMSAAGLLRSAESESMVDRTLRQIVEKQKQLFAEAEKRGDNMDLEAFRTQAQSISHEYERLLAGAEKFAAGYAAYGYFLRQVDMKKEALAMLLKANQLDPNIAMVKNQIGNHLAEDGKPIEAAQYFLAAIKLSPNEPLYHYQFGTLLAEARDTFLKSGEWTRPALDQSLQQAFRKAAELAPDRVEFSFSYAKSFYEVEHPDWQEAIKVWSQLEESARTTTARQMMRAHAANVFLRMGKKEHAKALLNSIDDPKLQEQKAQLLEEIAAPSATP